MLILLAVIVGLLMLAVDFIENGLVIGFLGIKGLFLVFFAVFVIVVIYKVCVKNNVIICMFDEVLFNIL